MRVEAPLADEEFIVVGDREHRRTACAICRIQHEGRGQLAGQFRGKAARGQGFLGRGLAIGQNREQFAGQYEGKRVVISGQSLGTALAAGLAAELCAAGHTPDLTLLVSPYSSMRALADELYPWVPRQVLRYPLHTAEAAARLSGPLMLIHGDKDELIGIHHSEALRTAAPAAQFLRVEGAGHSDVHKFPSFRKALAGALGAL